MFKKLKKIFRAKPSIAVLNLNGVIGINSGLKSGISMESISEQIEQAFDQKNLKLVALKINSPGGSPVQSELIHKYVKQLAKEKNVKTIAFIEDCAASGGYWLACAADEIYAAENSLIGSIGVVSAGFGFEKAIEKLGINRRVYTQGSSKSVLDPFSKEKGSDIQILMDVQKEVYDNFKELVKSSRKNLAKDKYQDIFSGAFWASKAAKDLGLIDDINHLHSYIHQKFGKDIKIIKINSKKPWIKSKLGLLNEETIDLIFSKIEQKIKHLFEVSKF